MKSKFFKSVLHTISNIMEVIWEAKAIWEAGDLGGFVSIQGGNKAIWEPKVRPWQVTAKSSQVKPN